jgi:hypothetical protein
MTQEEWRTLRRQGERVAWGDISGYAIDDDPLDEQRKESDALPRRSQAANHKDEKGSKIVSAG